jgi:hypothetical protein
MKVPSVLIQQSFVLRIDGSVAFAGGFFQSFEVRNFDVSSAVLDDPGRLQRVGNGGHAIALHTDHLGQEVLRQLQSVFTSQIVHTEQPAREAAFSRMHRIARRGLLGLRKKRLFVSDECRAETDAVRSDGPQNADVEGGRYARQLNDGVGQRNIAVERGGRAKDAVLADHRHFHHTATSKAYDQRNNPVMGKENFRESIAGTHQHCFLNQFDPLKVRTKQLEIRSWQSGQ